jgi:hypothetical protein
MCRALVLDGVDEEVDGIDVVAVNKYAPSVGAMKLLEELAQLACLSPWMKTVGNGIYSVINFLVVFL